MVLVLSQGQGGSALRPDACSASAATVQLPAAQVLPTAILWHEGPLGRTTRLCQLNKATACEKARSTQQLRLNNSSTHLEVDDALEVGSSPLRHEGEEVVHHCIRARPHNLHQTSVDAFMHLAGTATACP